MPIDNQTSRHKGFAFVQYASVDSANMVLQTMNGFMLGGRPLKVGRPNNSTGGAAAAGFGGNSMMLGGMQGGMPAQQMAMMAAGAGVMNSMNPMMMAQSSAAAANIAASLANQNSAGQGTNPQARVYVGSVPFEVSPE